MTLGTAFYAVKLASLLMTKEEAQAMIAGLMKAKFFANVFKKVSQGCETDRQLEFSIAVAKMYKNMIEVVSRLPKHALQEVWEIHRFQVLQAKTAQASSLQSSLNRTPLSRFSSPGTESISPKEIWFPGNDPFISEHLKLMACIEEWLPFLAF